MIGMLSEGTGWQIGFAVVTGIDLLLHSLGEFPYNGGVFYGNADTHLQVTTMEDYELWTQTELEVPVTSQT